MFIAHLYQHDWTWCLPYCDPNIEYFGGSLEGRASGIAELKETMNGILVRYSTCLPIVVDANAQLLPGNQAAIVTMRCFLATDLATDEVQARRMRATLIWLVDGETPRLRHIHISSPSTTAFSEENTPEISRDAFTYAKMLFEHLLSLSNITLHDVAGNIHQVSPAEVLYVEAQRQKTVVHCLDRDIVARRGFAKTVEELGKTIVAVHRSFAVNLMYVRVVQTGAVVLNNGIHIPLPQRRAREVRQDLEQSLRTLRPQFASLGDRTQKQTQS